MIATALNIGLLIAPHLLLSTEENLEGKRISSNIHVYACTYYIDDP